MKTKEELAMIKEEYDDVKEKLAELTDEELEQVTGGKGITQIPNKIDNDSGNGNSKNNLPGWESLKVKTNR